MEVPKQSKVHSFTQKGQSRQYSSLGSRIAIPAIQFQYRLYIRLASILYSGRAAGQESASEC